MNKIYINLLESNTFDKYSDLLTNTEILSFLPAQSLFLKLTFVRNTSNYV
jgi:hypothetical protein